MANRVTDAEVKEIISVTWDTTPQIGIANVLVTKYLQGEDCMTTELLKEIERFLAAHFVELKQRVLRSRKAGEATDTYATHVGMGFEATVFGQQALVMDCTSKLATLSEKKRKVIFAAMTPTLDSDTNY